MSGLLNRLEQNGLTAQVEAQLDQILEKTAQGVTLAAIADAAGVKRQRFAEAVRRAVAKRQGLTATGKPRQRRGGPRLLVSPRAAELAAAEGAPPRSPMPGSQPTVSPDRQLVHLPFPSFGSWQGLDDPGGAGGSCPKGIERERTRSRRY